MSLIPRMQSALVKLLLTTAVYILFSNFVLLFAEYPACFIWCRRLLSVLVRSPILNINCCVLKFPVSCFYCG